MTKRMISFPRTPLPGWLPLGSSLLLLAVSLLAALILAFFLAWVSNGYATGFSTGPEGFVGWSSFLAALLLAGVLMAAVWAALQSSESQNSALRAGEKSTLPAWLGWVLVLAFLVRLGAGALWSTALPKYGFEGEVENAGYVMADAYERDQAAWELAQSDKPLLRAFQGAFRKADQYGGLLYLSAWVYRYMGAPVHQPLLMIVFAAAVSALGVLVAWGLARRAWGDPTIAKVAAIGLAFYPEAVLLGSSQMREAFTLTFTSAAFYGLLRFAQTRSWSSLTWVLLPVLIYLSFSPPFTAWLLAMLVLAALGLGRKLVLRRGVHHSWRFWVLVTGIVVLVLGGAWISLMQFAPEGRTNPIQVVDWWLRKSADLQATRTEAASGWLQKIFDNTPDWLESPILIGYGIAQPFLPAAVMHRSESPVWWLIGIWRALGWNSLLALLAYSSLRAMFWNGRHAFTRILVPILWLSIFVAAFRAGGDQWDNSRYRATFAGLQVALVCWAVVEQRRQTDPWLRRALVGAGLVLAWFVPWYLRRYTDFPWYITDVFRTLALGLASAALFAIWDWARLQPGTVRERYAPPAPAAPAWEPGLGVSLARGLDAERGSQGKEQGGQESHADEGS